MRDNLQRYEETTRIVKRPRTSHSALATHRMKENLGLLLEPERKVFWRQSHLEGSLPFRQRTQPAQTGFMERNLRAIPCTLSVLSPVILGLPIGQAGRRLQVGIGIRLLPGASMGNPACGKGHEERDLTNTKAGSGLRGPPGLS